MFGGSRMIYIYSFLFCGLVCMISQLILDNTKLTPGHVTSLFVVIGAGLDTFSIYDKIIDIFGAGALVPITSFGHSLIHGAIDASLDNKLLGLSLGMFKLTSVGIVSAVIFAFFFALIFKPKN